MPIYEYRCQECQEELEALRKLSDEPLVDCPACGKPALIKKVSAAAFRLKGGGWYETDFKTGNKKNIAGGSDSGGSKEPSSGSKESSGGSSDSKSSASTSKSSDSKKTA